MNRPLDERELHELTSDEVTDTAREILESVKHMRDDNEAVEEARKRLIERGFELDGAYVSIDTFGRKGRARIPKGPFGEIDVTCFTNQ